VTEKTLIVWTDLRNTYGNDSRERRYRFLVYLAQDNEIFGGGLPVNRKWQMNTKRDPDIKALLKKGLIRQRRVGHVSPRQTYLFITEKGKEFVKRNNLKIKHEKNVAKGRKFQSRAG